METYISCNADTDHVKMTCGVPLTCVRHDKIQLLWYASSVQISLTSVSFRRSVIFSIFTDAALPKHPPLLNAAVVIDQIDKLRFCQQRWRRTQIIRSSPLNFLCSYADYSPPLPFPFHSNKFVVAILKMASLFRGDAEIVKQFLPIVFLAFGECFPSVIIFIWPAFKKYDPDCA